MVSEKNSAIDLRSGEFDGQWWMIFIHLTQHITLLIHVLIHFVLYDTIVFVICTK